MHILYGYSNCTNKKYNEIFHNCNVSVLLPDQKYHSLLIRGLAGNGAALHCFSGLPINRSVTKKLLIHENSEKEGNAEFHYYRTVNFPVIRQMMIFFGGFWNTLIFPKKKDTYVVIDCLNIANSFGMMLAAKIRKFPVACIVTDLPEMLDTGGVIARINNLLFTHMDSFILLTEQMNGIVNRKDRPYIVMEGHVDSKHIGIHSSEKWEESGKRVVLYAGSLQRLYGIQILTEGFIKANITDAELWICGDGDYREELEALAQNHSNIKYKGLLPNNEIIEYERRAALLVNPRPSAPEYTKYSFPSKNMEYMVSGTPLLTTKLPGMPKDHYSYVYFLENETADGIAETLTKILEIPFPKRQAKGRQAREFVLREKSEMVQGRKLIHFLDTLKTRTNDGN